MTSSLSQDVRDYIASIEPESKQRDIQVIIDMLAEESHYPAYLHGNMVGFGSYHYQYESGREGDFFVTGCAARKASLTVYIMPGFNDYESLLAKLGKHKLGKSCLYINKLSDIDMGVLREIVRDSVKVMQQRYVCIDPTQ
jgi:hypothetical protein